MKNALLLVLALTAVGCGPQGQDMHLLVERSVEKYYPGSGGETISVLQWLDMETFQPYTGKVFQLHEERLTSEDCGGDLRLTGYLLNGHFDGEINLYFCGGDPYQLRTYSAGRLRGLHMEYGFDGTVWSRGNYDGLGSRCGEWMESKEYRAYPPCPSFD